MEPQDGSVHNMTHDTADDEVCRFGSGAEADGVGGGVILQSKEIATWGKEGGLGAAQQR